MSGILDQVNTPDDVKKLSMGELYLLAAELRMMASGLEFIVPGATVGERCKAVDELGVWLVGKGWSGGKGEKKSRGEG